jgi:hypothetical protein
MYPSTCYLIGRERHTGDHWESGNYANNSDGLRAYDYVSNAQYTGLCAFHILPKMTYLMTSH